MEHGDPGPLCLLGLGLGSGDHIGRIGRGRILDAGLPLACCACAQQPVRSGQRPGDPTDVVYSKKLSLADKEASTLVAGRRRQEKSRPAVDMEASSHKKCM